MASSSSIVRVDDTPIADQVERKFVLDAETARLVWRVASGQLRVHHRDAARPVTYHRTTYFDTPDYAFYRASGAHRRLRVREYATGERPSSPPILASGCFVELKLSGNGMRQKARLELGHGQVADGLRQLHDGPLSACLMTWYQRAALTCAAERLRVTLDSRIAFCRPVAIGSACEASAPASAFARGPDYILEIKSRDELPAWLLLLVRGLREAHGFSKFGVGMALAERRGLLLGR